MQIISQRTNTTGSIIQKFHIHKGLQTLAAITAFVLSCIGFAFIKVGNCTNTASQLSTVTPFNSNALIISNITASNLLSNITTTMMCCYGVFATVVFGLLLFINILVFWPLSYSKLKKIRSQISSMRLAIKTNDLYSKMSLRRWSLKLSNNSWLICFLVTSLVALPLMFAIAFEKCPLSSSTGCKLLLASLCISAMSAISMLVSENITKSKSRVIPQSLRFQNIHHRSTASGTNEGSSHDVIIVEEDTGTDPQEPITQQHQNTPSCNKWPRLLSGRPRMIVSANPSYVPYDCPQIATTMPRINQTKVSSVKIETTEYTLLPQREALSLTMSRPVCVQRTLSLRVRTISEETTTSTESATSADTATTNVSSSTD